ncbi:hypothetical protein DIPPA_51444, partial [Diplonema papillatum]
MSVLGMSSLIVICSAVAFFQQHTSKVQYTYLLPVGVGLVFVITLIVTRRASSAFMSCFLVALALVVVLVFDLVFAALAEQRAWPCVMFLLDVNLLASGPEWVSQVVMGITLVWLLMSSAEEAFRFGMYDIFSDFDWDATVRICDCDDPPC